MYQLQQLIIVGSLSMVSSAVVERTSPVFVRTRQAHVATVCATCSLSTATAAQTSASATDRYAAVCESFYQTDCNAILTMTGNLNTMHNFVSVTMKLHISRKCAELFNKMSVWWSHVFYSMWTATHTI